MNLGLILKAKLYFFLISVFSFYCNPSLASAQKDCEPQGRGVAGSIIQVESIPGTSDKIIKLKNENLTESDDGEIVFPLKWTPGTLIYSDFASLKGKPFTPKVGDKIIYSTGYNKCFFNSSTKNLSEFREMVIAREMRMTDETKSVCRVKNKHSFEEALLVAISNQDSPEKLMRLFKLESEFIPENSEKCNYTIGFLYYLQLARFNNQDAFDPFGLKRLEGIKMNESLRQVLLSDKICGPGPEKEYLKLQSQNSLTEEQQDQVLLLEKKLGFLHLSEPLCFKYGVWKIDLKNIEKRMESFRKCSDGGCWFEWDKYKNPKINSKRAIFVAQLKEDFPEYTKLESCGGDGTEYTPDSMVEKLKSYCQLYSEPQFRKVLRARVLEILKDLDTSSLEVCDSKSNPAERKATLKYRLEARNKVTDGLNNFCR